MPATPRLASTVTPGRGPARNRSRTGLDDPQTTSAPAGTASISVAATPGSASPAWSSRSSALARAAAAAACQAGSHPSSRMLGSPAAAGAAGVGTAGRTRAARWAGSVQVGPAATTSSGADASRRATARLSVCRPTARIRSGRCAAGNPPRSSRSPPGNRQGPDASSALGSATTGQPRASASATAAVTDGAGASPSTTTVRAGRSSATGPGGAGGTTSVHGRPPGRPASDSGHPVAAGRAASTAGQCSSGRSPAAAGQWSPGSGTSGSRRARFSCTGAPAATARQIVERQYAFWPARISGVPSSTNRAAEPNRPSWSTVWFAPTPRSSGGRSAVSASSGTPACAASSTAGCRFAAAVPDVVTTTTGRPDAFASPSARNPADRSSIRTCSRSRPAASAACSANASGADRDPGASTASRTPHRTSSSTSTRPSAVDGFTAPSRPTWRGSAAAGSPTRPTGPAARPARPAGPGPG